MECTKCPECGNEKILSLDTKIMENKYYTNYGCTECGETWLFYRGKSVRRCHNCGAEVTKTAVKLKRLCKNCGEKLESCSYRYEREDENKDSIKDDKRKGDNE